jgi:hypothetical protein
MPIFLTLLLYFDISTHPEVHIQVSTSSKFPVADLEGDGHPVIGVQHFVEALARVSSQLHVVRKAEHNAGQQHQQRVERGRHDCVVAANRWSDVVVVRLDATVVGSLGVVGGLCRKEGSQRCRSWDHNEQAYINSIFARLSINCQ